MALAVAVTPAEAKKKQKSPVKLAEDSIPDPANGEPLTLIISLDHQKIDVYRGTTLVVSSKVSSGMSDYPTKTGVFSILEKQRFHHSNMYSAAPMPWMQRLTRSGTALHGGVVPGYPASHGCIRLPFSFAPKLYKITNLGDNVVVARGPPSPKLIAHPNLFQPPPTQAQSSQQPEDAPGSPADGSLAITVPEDNSSKAADPEPGTAGPLASGTEATNESTNATSTMTSTDTTSYSINPSQPMAGSAPPLRILVTRRTQRDVVIGVQYILASMGYLMPQNFDGTVGKATVTAIKAFEKANGLHEKGAVTDRLVKMVYQVAGKDDPPEGHLFVRQGYNRVFDAPIVLVRPSRPLGTHIFTAMKFDPGDATTKWMAISLEGGDSTSALDRIEIPTDVRQQISEKLTPGSTLIVADASDNSAILLEGDDFLVASSDTAAVEKPKAKHTATKQAKTKKVTKPQIAEQAWLVRRRDRAWRYYSYQPPAGFPRHSLFPRWGRGNQEAYR